MNNSENRLERKCSCCGGDNPEKQRIDAILEKYADVKGPLIPILQEVQNLYNYLPKDVLEYIADKTGTPISEIYGVVTFYSLFHLNPRGRNVIRVCQELPAMCVAAKQFCRLWKSSWVLRPDIRPTTCALPWKL